MTGQRHWTLDTIEWGRFDGSRVDPDMLKVVKAASLVEHNGHDYAAYLCRVFSDDPCFQEQARVWGDEEVRHGKALARWVALADPDWDFEAAFRRFREGYKLPLDTMESVRGSRIGELVARCIVESGTSSYYTAMADATDEPVLNQVCRLIAADEFRHYKLFYDSMFRYADREKPSRFHRFMVAARRFRESEDDELAYAYYASNNFHREYDYKSDNQAYMLRAYSLYRRRHMDRAVGMMFKAAGLKPNTWFSLGVSKMILFVMALRSKLVRVVPA